MIEVVSTCCCFEIENWDYFQRKQILSARETVSLKSKLFTIDVPMRSTYKQRISGRARFFPTLSDSRGPFSRGNYSYVATNLVINCAMRFFPPIFEDGKPNGYRTRECKIDRAAVFFFCAVHTTLSFVIRADRKKRIRLLYLYPRYRVVRKANDTCAP